jgi:hypothetical protein
VIEDRGSIGSGERPPANRRGTGGPKMHQTRGRKPKDESRSPEFRRRLVEWKRMPESARPPLRALARELGTSHQLLTHYLGGLEKWQVKEAWRCAREYRAQANANGRPMTSWEALQSRALDRHAFCLQMDAGMNEALATWEREIEQAVRDGKPVAPELPKMVRKIAASGNEKAQAMLTKYFSPEARQRLGLKFLRKHIPRLEETISRFQEIGGVLLLDEGQIRYFTPSKDTESRALLTELGAHREEVKRIIGEWVRRLTEQGTYEEIKQKICQRIPPSLLSPLDEFTDTGATPQKATGERQHGIA